MNETKELKAHQKANWIPGMPEMCWKHLLHANFERQKARFGEAPFSFWPQGWNLPEDYDKLKSYYEARGEGNDIPVILKPSMQACGNGIRCMTNMSQLPEDDPFLQIKSVAQHYIHRPLLLDGFKVTFRIYVLISSYAPLRAYIYPNGLGRICSQRYTEEMASFDNLFAHLTNYDINKHNINDFLENKGEGMQAEGLTTDGLRTDFLTVMNYLKRQGYDTDALWHKMTETTALTLLATDAKVSSISASAVKYRSTTFEILGFDFLIDQDMNPWILEVNHAPNLEPHTPLETDLKRGMIRDALQLVDISRKEVPSTHELSHALSEAIEKMNAAGINIDSQLKYVDSKGNDCVFPLSTLNKVEIWTMIEAEKEANRTGEWQTVFPTPDAETRFTLTDSTTGEDCVLYSEGFGGRRNTLAVQFLQIGISVQQILEMAEQALQSS